MGASDTYSVETIVRQNGAVLARFTWEQGTPPAIPGGMLTHPVSFSKPVVGPTAIGAAIDAWTADMERRGKTAGTTRVFPAQVRRLVAALGWEDPREMTYAGASGYLATRRKERNWSGTTTDGVVSAFRCFSRFCLAAGLLSQDPFLALGRSGEVGGPGNRALTLDEARRLILVGYAASARDRRCKVPRGLWYGFLFLTGLRSHEAGLCRWGDVDFDPACPAIYADPSWSKNGKRQRVVLAPELIPKLEEWKRCVPAGAKDPVFPHVSNKGTFAADRVAAGIPELDARQRRCGLHSARKSLATWLYNAGVSDAVIARILRHETTMSQARYIDPDPSMEVDAMGRLPRVFPGVENFPDSQVPQDKGLRTFSRGIVHDRLKNEATFTDHSLSDDRLPRQAELSPRSPEGRRTPSLTGSGGRVPQVGVDPGPEEGSAAGRDSPSGESRDEDRPASAGLNGHCGLERDPVLIFAQAVERLGRLLTERRDATHADRSPARPRH